MVSSGSVSQRRGIDGDVNNGADKMVSASLTFVTLLCLALLVIVWGLPVVSNGLYAPQNAYQFAPVSAGAVVRHIFVVRNLHFWPVEVTGVRGGCGCTKAFIGKEAPFRLRPFESVEIHAALDTSDKVGEVQQTIAVMTDDKPSGTLLFMQGRVDTIASPPQTSKGKLIK